MRAVDEWVGKSVVSSDVAWAAKSAEMLAEKLAALTVAAKVF